MTPCVPTTGYFGKKYKKTMNQEEKNAFCTKNMGKEALNDY